MQGGALGDSHAVAEKSSKAGLLVEPMEKPTGGGFTSLGLKTSGAPVRGLGGPWTSVRRPVGVQVGRVGLSVRVDGPRTARAALGGIQAAGSFGRMRMRTTRGAIAELASRRSEVEKAAWASDQNIKTQMKLPLHMGVYLIYALGVVVSFPGPSHLTI